MRDLHSHFLPGVDDGSSNIETTKRMLSQAKIHGITDIMFTPHYIVDSKYESDKMNNDSIFNEIREIALNEYGINVFLGNEVYCSNNMLNLLKSGKIRTLNDSRYMLIEIPMFSKMNNVKSLFFELISSGVIPILAHPERYTAYYNDFKFFKELRNMGVLMQVNYPSFIGLYGKKAKKMSKKLLKMGLISFIGSDIHHDTDKNYQVLEKALKIIKKNVTENEYINITTNNFARVVMNQEIN